MAFTVQNTAGSVDNANAYISVATFQTYHSERGNVHNIYLDAVIERAIITATDYLDQRFRYIGEKQGQNQRTQWPRLDTEDANGDTRSGIPFEIEEATAEYAFLHLTGTSLNPTPARDSTGQTLKSKSEAVGSVSETVVYVAGGPFELPKFPIADNRMKASGLVRQSNSLSRA